MLRLLNIVFLAFIYLNVIAPKWTINDVSLSKAVFTVSLVLYVLYAFLNPTPGLSKALPYVVTCFALVAVLAIIGSVKGSHLEDIVTFASPVLMLLAIPLIQVLTRHYGRDVYLRHITVSTLLLALYVLYLWAAKGPLQLPDSLLPLPAQPGFTSISFPGGVPKVFVVTSAFFPFGLVASYYLAFSGKRSYYYLAILLIAGSVYVGQTLDIWIASILAMAGGALLIGTGSLMRTLILWTAIPMATMLMLGGMVSRQDILNPTEIIATKFDSIDQKQTQTSELLSVFAESPVFGRGLGHVYQMKEISALSDYESLYAEASYGMILASTGLVGSACYAFIYLYPPLLYFLKITKSASTTVIAISHLAVLVASVGLPYLWSGGIGFFFLAFLVAWIHLPETQPETSRLPTLASHTTRFANATGWF